MSRLSGWDIAAAVIVIAVILSVVFFFDFLNKHQWIVTGFAGVATAVASIFIAKFSRGTWGLFKFEQEQVEARRQHLRTRVISLLVSVSSNTKRLEAVADLLEEGLHPLTKQEQLERVFEELNPESEEYLELLEEAKRTSTELLSALEDCKLCIKTVREMSTFPAACSPDGLRKTSELINVGADKLRSWVGLQREPKPTWEVESLKKRIREIDQRNRDAQPDSEGQA